MSFALKKVCEIALAREFFKVPGLKAITPKIWDADTLVKQPFLNIQATITGEEMVWRTGIYPVTCTVRIEGKPRRGMNLSEKIALVDATILEIAQLDADSLHARFQGTGVFVHGVIPKGTPASFEGDNRIDSSGCDLVANLNLTN